MQKIDNIVVVKIGSNTLVRKTSNDTETLDSKAFRTIAGQIKKLRAQGVHPILISSAAITAGMCYTGVSERPSKQDMPLLQRFASIGWRHVLNSWSEALPGDTVGELLLTEHELHLKSERQEALRTIYTLLQYGDIPIINENDAISHDEISFGDNDILAATLAAKLRQSPLFGDTVRLVILSDVHGVYRDRNDPSTLISCIKDIQAHSSIAGGAGSHSGTGGMVSKFRAANIAGAAHVECWVTHGKTPGSVLGALNQTCGTHFALPTETRNLPY